LLSDQTYLGPEEPLPEVDRVFDTVISKSERDGVESGRTIIYVEDAIFSAFPPPYLEHYERLKNVSVKKKSEMPSGDAPWWAHDKET